MILQGKKKTGHTLISRKRQRSILGPALIPLVLFACFGTALGEKPSAVQPGAAPKTVQLNLEEVVRLVLENNRDVKNAFLQRRSSIYSLKEAEDTFMPNLTIQSSLQKTEDKAKSDLSGSADTESQQVSVGAGIEKRFITGASANLDLTNAIDDEDSDQTQAGTSLSTGTYTSSRNVTLSLKQPLLRNAGIAVNTAPVEIARKNDAISALELQSNLNTAITDATLAFRKLIQTWKSTEIEAGALERAEEQHRKIARLIELGRMAPVDLVQAEAEISTSRLKLIQAQNNFEASQLELNKLLDVDTNYRVMPKGDVIVEHVPLVMNTALQTALANRPDYLQAKHNVAISRLQVLTTANNRLWNIDLQAGFSKDLEDEKLSDGVTSDDNRSKEEWMVGIVLSHTFGDESRNREYHQARIALKQAENTLQNVEENIQIEVANSIRNIRQTYRAYQLSQKARELTEKKLEVEMKKLEAGRSSAFTVATFKNDVARAKTDELNAAIEYLNALTLHDSVLGISRKKWDISLEPYNK